jgi:Domain of unknown function (DUF4293)
MIQRIQSLYLLMTTILSAIFLEGKLFTFIDRTGSGISITLTGIYKETGNQAILLNERILPFAIIIIIILILSLGTIFVFKNRKIQLWLTRSIILFIVVLIFLETYYAVHIIKEFNGIIVPGFSLFIPVLLLLFSFLAHRGIQKDENLVRSYDRLR